VFIVTSTHLLISPYIKQVVMPNTRNKHAPTSAQTNKVNAEPAAITVQYTCSSITAHSS
jgi:hypothetical protein